MLLKFYLTQHNRDECLMRSLVNYFEVGKYYPSSIKKYGDYQVYRFSEILDKIIPFFQKYTIQGEKSKDFEDFCLVSQLMIKGAHLTEKGLAEIRKIKERMNSRRE